LEIVKSHERASDGKAAFRGSKGGREGVWVDMKPRVLNFGDDALGNFTRWIRARVCVQLAKNSSAFLTRQSVVFFWIPQGKQTSVAQNAKTSINRNVVLDPVRMCNPFGIALY
jgi:hypothetical protein